MDYENVVTEIIANSGMARSIMLRSVCEARKNDFEKVESMFKEAQDYLTKAHQIQTDLIQQEVRGKNHEVTLLMVHAQDHLMTSITVNEIIRELVEEIRIRLNA